MSTLRVLLLCLSVGRSTPSDKPVAAFVPRKTPAEIAPYPPMAWHSWGLFTHENLVTEANMQEMAEALVSSGMVAAGYDTVNVVCNGWAGRDPSTGVLIENRTLWPSGIAGFAKRLHAMKPPLKVGCYTSPRSKNCMCGPAPQGGCEEGTGVGYEQRDMEFFAQAGCDHIMVDMPDSAPVTFKGRYDTIGAAIANSSNPNMVYGVWCSPTHPEKWAGNAGGNYWRLAGDIYNSWSAVLRQWDVAYSIPNINRFSRKGSYAFLDQMVVGDVPHRKGSAYGAGLSHNETVAHMSMWVMAASPLLTCTDVRNMTTEVKEILTNSEVLEVHKDSLAKMASRVDVGYGSGTDDDQEIHSANICRKGFPTCEEGPGDPNYPGQPCQVCHSNWSVFEKPLHDNSSAVMVLNRGDGPVNVTVDMMDLGLTLGDWPHETWSARDLWSKSDLGVFSGSLTVAVPAHGVRLLRMHTHAKPPPSSPLSCPAGWLPHAPGLWANPSPSGNTRDTANATGPLCARKCNETQGCLAFEVYELPPRACYIFINELKEPFTANPDCFACVSKHAHPKPEPKSPPPPAELLVDTRALGLPFEGIGGLNGGNGARLLANYPQPQRATVLDILFKPDVGCALQILKVEIGADGLAANAGGEPAVRHTKGGPLRYNGTNFFLMREAVKRNRNITLYGLSWSFPGWFAGRNALGVDQAEYSADWVDGVREFHKGKLIVSVWNEQNPKAATADYAKLLRATLDRRGHSDVLVMWPDSCCNNGDWDSIAAMINDDSALAKSVDVLGSHYPTESRTCPVSALAPDTNDYRSTCAKNGLAAATKKPLYDSEAWGAGGVEGDAIGGGTMARMLNWEPIVGRISATVVWQILWGSYDGIGWTNNSLIRAASPWSGAFEMLPSGYAVAHHTRFSAAGWRYLQDGKGCGWLPGGGSYVTRVSSDGRDFSIVIESMNPDVSCDCDTCGGSQKSKPARAWAVASMQNITLHVKGPHCSGRSLTRVESQPFSASPRWFSSMSSLKLDADCKLRLTVPSNTQLTLSTLTASQTPVPPSPPETRFPLPYRANFSGPSGEPSGMPSYFQDLNGAFQLAAAFDGGSEPVMEQVSRHVPIMWYGQYNQAKLPLTIFGDERRWVNVSVAVTVALVSSPITDPYGWNSSYGNVKPQNGGLAMTGHEVCLGNGPPLDCAWANTSATVAVRVGGGASSWIKSDNGYFLTVSVSGQWHVEAAESWEPPPPQPPPPPPPFPRQPCPAKGWKSHKPDGFWANASPPGGKGDTANASVPLCAKKCAALDQCLAFEVFDGTSGPNGPACYIFIDKLATPFTSQPECITCVKVKDEAQDTLETGDESEPTHEAGVGTRSESETGASVRVLASGHLTNAVGLGSWHNMSLAIAGCRLTATVDGVLVADVIDVGCDATLGGWGAVGSGWHAAQFKEVTAAVA